jgi:FkbM family methyltransferase
MRKGEIFSFVERVKDKKLSFEALIHFPLYKKYLRGVKGNTLRVLRILHKYRGSYEIIRSDSFYEIVLTFNNEKFSFKLPLLVNDENLLLMLRSLLTLKQLNAIIHDINNRFIVRLPDTTWVTRKTPWDLIQGPLLPIILEPYEYRQWFMGHIRGVGLFVDVGANIGGYAIRACNSGINVIAIEPDPENFSLLLENVRANRCEGKVETFNIAAGDESGYAKLYLPDPINFGSISLVRSISSSLRSEVQVKPLDEVLSNFACDMMVKIDVEGFEFHVLKGMVNTLKKVKYLIIEIRDENKRLVKDFLKSYGFKLKDVHEMNYLWAR